MPRKAATAATTPSSASASTAKKGHKRQLSSQQVSGTLAVATPTPTSGSRTTGTPGTRASKRIKESVLRTPTTGKKSKYFDGSDSDEADEDMDEGSLDDASESGYEDENVDVDGEDGEDEEGDYDSAEDEEEEGKRAKKRGKSKKGTVEGRTVFGKQNAQLWREGVKTGLGPGKQVFIEKPKPRGDGGIKYRPDTIHPNTMLFLADLKANNDREWLKMHDPDFRQSWKDWESLVQRLSEEISQIDETVPELPPKDLVFRIYRDVRFSRDPTPYKPHFSAAWSRTGRKGPYACYYVQISPHGKSFVGAGLWMPEAQPLAAVRRSIDRKPEKIRKVLTDAAMRKHIFGGMPNDEKKAVKAFASQNQENALKTKPKGFEADHPNIELLRLRNFTVGRRLSEEQVLSPGLVRTISTLMQAMFPMVSYLNSVVMPDEDASSSDESGQDGEE